MGPQMNRWRLIDEVSVYLQDRSNCLIVVNRVFPLQKYKKDSIVFNIGPPKESIFLTTIYGLYVLGIYQWIQSDLSYTYVLLLLSRTYSVLNATQNSDEPGIQVSCVQMVTVWAFETFFMVNTEHVRLFASTLASTVEIWITN